MSRVVAAARDLTRPSDDADTLSISCERGAFLVPPLLFSFCLGENKNHLLRAACCLLRAVLGNALSEVSQPQPRGSGGTGLARPGGCLGDVMGNADAPCQPAGRRKPLPLATSAVPSSGGPPPPQPSPSPRPLSWGAAGFLLGPRCHDLGFTLGRTGGRTPLSWHRCGSCLLLPRSPSFLGLCSVGPSVGTFLNGWTLWGVQLEGTHGDRKPGSCRACVVGQDPAQPSHPKCSNHEKPAEASEHRGLQPWRVLRRSPWMWGRDEMS